MNVLYKLLLYIHILSAVLSIGPFFVLIPLVSKLQAAGDTERQAYLDTFRWAIRLGKHAGHVLVVSGICLALIGSWSWTTSWIVMTVIILLGSLFFLARAFSPILRKFDEPKQDRADVARRLRRSIWIYLVLLMTMLWFMVAKPVLW